MNRILMLAIAASSGNAAANTAAATPMTTIVETSSSSLAAEDDTLGVHYGTITLQTQTLTSPPTTTTTATAVDTDASLRRSKTAKNEKENEIHDTSSTAATDMVIIATTTDPAQQANHNDNSHHNVHYNSQHNDPSGIEGKLNESQQQQHDYDHLGKSSKSKASSGGKGGKTSKPTTDDDDSVYVDEGTAWSPGSIPPSMAPISSSLPPSSTPSPSSSTLPSISSLHPTTTTTPALPALTWMGVNGCTPTNPCDACSGDCDTDSDCLQIMDDKEDDNIANSTNSSNNNIHDNVDLPVMEIVSLQQNQQRQRRRKSMTTACYKRADGSTDQVPGCQVGGEGDIPGADYCYYKDQVVVDDDDDDNDKRSGVPTYLPTAANTNLPTTKSFPELPSVSKPPSLTPSILDTGNLPPAQHVTRAPSHEKTLWPSAFGIVEEQIEAYFIQSNANSGGGGGDGTATSLSASTSSGTISTIEIRMDDETSNPPSSGRQSLLGGSESGSMVQYWCASGALSPNYYQLLLEECAYGNRYGVDNSSGNSIIVRMEQMDQLWSMDSKGYIHSVWDYERCMTVPIYAVDNVDQVPVKIGPCDHDASSLSQFYYDNQTLKLVGYNRLCVTFEGGDVATKGSPMILAPCRENEDKFGWDFILKQDQDEVLQQPSSAPIKTTPSPFILSDLPRLQYLGRSGCGGELSPPCQSCSGDCDVDDDCQSGLLCFQRAIGDSSQVPGCASGGPGDIPGADYCFDPSYVEDDGGEERLPYLRWRGAEGCTAENPCPACKGDCDEDEDCQGLYKCLKRLVGDTTQVPGCAVGGRGDIPGGDYCYDPSILNEEDSGITSGSPTPAKVPPSISNKPISMKPTKTTMSIPSFGEDSSAPTTSVAKVPMYPTFQSMPISSESVTSQLQYLGRNACNTSAPCQSCAGDCDSDNDCSGDLMCFQRAIGDSSQVPGCEVGGVGDIPGADYCFDAAYVNGNPASSSAALPPTSSSAGVTLLPLLRWLGTESCTPESPCLACVGECDDDDDCNGPFMCFKRLLGEETQIPGCAVGGLDDVPGGDYCYDPSYSGGSLLPSSTPPEFGGDGSTIKSEFTKKNIDVPSSAPDDASKLRFQINPSLVANSKKHDSTSDLPRTTSSDKMAKKNRKGKNTKDQINDSQLKGHHNGAGDSSIAVIERRRKHETTRKEREHLNTDQKDHANNRRR